MPLPRPDELEHNNDNLPIIQGSNAKGAWITVGTQAQLLMIPVAKLTLGQVVRVHNTNTTYYLNDLSNPGDIASWVVFNSGGPGHAQNTDTGTTSATFDLDTDGDQIRLDASTTDVLRITNDETTPADIPIQVSQVYETNITTGSSTTSGAISLNATNLRAHRVLLNGNVTSFNFTGTISRLVDIRISIQADQAGRTIAFAAEYNTGTTYNVGNTITAFYTSDPNTPSTTNTLVNQAVYVCNTNGTTGAFNASNWDLHIILDGGVEPILQPDVNHITNYVFTNVIDPHDSNATYWEATFLADKIT